MILFNHEALGHGLRKLMQRRGEHLVDSHRLINNASFGL